MNTSRRLSNGGEATGQDVELRNEMGILNRIAKYPTYLPDMLVAIWAQPLEHQKSYNFLRI